MRAGLSAFGENYARSDGIARQQRDGMSGKRVNGSIGTELPAISPLLGSTRRSVPFPEVLALCLFWGHREGFANANSSGWI
jgi:hypothetical protein